MQLNRSLGLASLVAFPLTVFAALMSNGEQPIPSGAELSSYSEFGCSNAKWDAEKAAWRTTLSVEQTQPGQEGGFCAWGAIRDLPDERKGAIYTISWSMMVPSGLNVESQTDAGVMKLMRINTRDAAGKNAGFIDVYEAHRRKDIPNARWGLIKENDPASWTWIAADEPNRGEFHSYQMRVVLDDISRALGGKASIQFSVDGNLLGESKPESVTLGGPDHIAQSIYFMSYYNGVAPEDQVRYFKDLEVAVAHTDNAPK